MKVKMYQIALVVLLIVLISLMIIIFRINEKENPKVDGDFGRVSDIFDDEGIKEESFIPGKYQTVKDFIDEEKDKIIEFENNNGIIETEIFYLSEFGFSSSVERKGTYEVIDNIINIIFEDETSEKFEIMQKGILYSEERGYLVVSDKTAGGIYNNENGYIYLDTTSCFISQNSELEGYGLYYCNDDIITLVTSKDKIYNLKFNYTQIELESGNVLKVSHENNLKKKATYGFSQILANIDDSYNISFYEDNVVCFSSMFSGDYTGKYIENNNIIKCTFDIYITEEGGLLVRPTDLEITFEKNDLNKKILHLKEFKCKNIKTKNLINNVINKNFILVK